MFVTRPRSLYLPTLANIWEGAWYAEISDELLPRSEVTFPEVLCPMLGDIKLWLLVILVPLLLLVGHTVDGRLSREYFLLTRDLRGVMSNMCVDLDVPSEKITRGRVDRAQERESIS